METQTVALRVLFKRMITVLYECLYVYTFGAENDINTLESFADVRLSIDRRLSIDWVMFSII